MKNILISALSLIAMTNLCLGMEKNPLASPFPSQTQNPFSKTSRFSHSSSFLPQTFSPFETPTPARRTLRCPSNELSNATPFKNRTVEFLSSPLGPVLQPSPTLPAISPIPPKDLLDWNELDFSTAATEILSFAGLTVSQTLIDKLVKYFRDTNHNHIAIGRVIIIGENPKTEIGKRVIFPIPNIFASGTSSSTVIEKWDDKIIDPDLKKIPVQSIGESGFECSPGTQAFYAHSERALITSLFQTTNPWNMEHIMSEYLKKYTEYLIDRIVIQIKIIHPKGACKNCLQFFESKATVADDLLFIGSPKSLKPKAKKRLNERYTETLKELDQILNLLTSIQDTIFQGISAIQESWNQIYGQSFGSKLLWEKLISDLSPIIDEKSKTANLQSVIQESSETPLTKISQIRSEVSELQRLNNLAQEMYSKKNFIESLQTLLNMKLLIKNLQEITQCVYNTLKQRLTNELQPTLKTFDIGTHTRRALETALYRTSSFLSSSSNDSDDFSSDSDTETQSFNTLSSSSASSSNPSTPKLSNDCTELELSTHSDFTPNPFSDSSDTESDDDIETFILPDAINSPQDNSDIVTPNPEITLPYKPIFSDSSPLHATSTPTFSVSTPKYPNINVYAMISTHSSASSSSENKTVLYKYFRDLQGMASDAAQESAPISANIPFGGYIE